MNLFRNLNKDEIEVRRARTFNNGKCELLLYKTARTDYNLLDETFGYYGWACQYKEENGILFCGIALKDPDTNTWIWRWNSGSEGNIEKEKAVASDALKRAGFAFGIGRELYTAPKIIVEPENDYTTFSVSEIGYDNKSRIVDLVIEDNKGSVVFNYHNGKKQKVQDVDPLDILTAICSELRESGEDYEELGKFYKYYKERIVNFDSVSNKTIYTLWKKWNKY